MFIKKQAAHDPYRWTTHARAKMRHYALSEARIKRVIRHPKRVEESIVPGLVAAMQTAESQKHQEIWVMYKIESSSVKTQKNPSIKIITAWRYPGKSPERDPVPQDIINEIKNLIS